MKAAALSYNASANSSPKLLAFSTGNPAKRLVELAQQEGVQLTKGQNDDLLNALEKLPLNSEIPPELYLAISRIYLYLIEQGRLKL